MSRDARPCPHCRRHLDAQGSHSWCARKWQDVNGIWHGGHVCVPCGHADARCERRVA